MTEAEWLACSESVSMLEFLKGQASERKLRLYLCGGCRHLTHLFFRPASLIAVEVAERFADGEATEEELDRAEWDAEAPTFGCELDNESFPHTAPFRKEVVPRLVEMGALPTAALLGGEWQVDGAVRTRLHAAAELAWGCAVWKAARAREEHWCPSVYLSRVDWPGRWLFDCVFGNPFRPVRMNPAWRTPAVCALSRTIYEERRFEDLPILADALEEAGCRHSDMLKHCRGPSLHARGCWVVDLILGKE